MARAFTYRGETGLMLLVEQKGTGWEVRRGSDILYSAASLHGARTYAESWLLGYEQGLGAAAVESKTDGFGRKETTNGD